jgi:hypothetical protein
LALLQRGDLLIVALVVQALPRAKQLPEGQPDKWEIDNNQGMDDFVANGFELKSVAYSGPQSDSPRVH